MILNLLSATAGVVGAIVVYFAVNATPIVLPYVIAFAAGSFLYVAMSDLIPDLHRNSRDPHPLRQTLLIAAGIATLILDTAPACRRTTCGRTMEAFDNVGLQGCESAGGTSWSDLERQVSDCVGGVCRCRGDGRHACREAGAKALRNPRRLTRLGCASAPRSSRSTRWSPTVRGATLPI